MASKVVLFFQLGKQGFTETWYNIQDAAANAAAAVPNSFYRKAVAFRSAACSLVAARFTGGAGPKQSVLKRFQPYFQGQASGTGFENGPDVTSTTAVMRLTSTNYAMKRMYIRGLWDKDVLRDAFGNDIVGGNFTAGINAYFNAAYQCQMQLLRGERPPFGGLDAHPVQKFHWESAYGPGLTGVSFQEGIVPTWGTGTPIVFSKIPTGLPHFPRKTRILFLTGVPPTAYYIVKYGLPGGQDVLGGLCQAFRNIPLWDPIDTWEFERFSEHKTGRPFGLLAGKARTAR